MTHALPFLRCGESLRASLLLGVGLILSSLAAPAAEITVLAASSLSDVLREVQPTFTGAKGHTVRFSFAASGTLARQIAEGAPADVFISADEARMEQLRVKGLILPDSVRIIALNTLVVVVAEDSKGAFERIEDLGRPRFRRVAIGDPATVPSGSYTRQVLESKGLWRDLQPKCLPVESVRAALAAVESGNADAAFVYRTDALLSKRVRIVWEAPRSPALSIVYPAAALASSKELEASRDFLTWLATPAAQAVFLRHGFLVPEP